jgi:uncharacterized protein YcbK (DUF882 family)
MTAHFTREEFACPHCHVALVRPQLVAKLEVVRSLVNKPIAIVSGYRCPVHNRDVHGAPDSQHMYAAAADIPHGVVPLDLARRAGFTGVGTKGPWAVHVDVRDGFFTTWKY